MILPLKSHYFDVKRKIYDLVLLKLNFLLYRGAYGLLQLIEILFPRELRDTA